jgi:peptide/nickel transport system permease protein
MSGAPAPAGGGQARVRLGPALARVVPALARVVPGRVPIGLVLAWAVVGLVLLWAAVPGVFTAYDPIAGVPAEKLRPPGAEHLFGTDAVGRDVFARVVHGSVHSLSGALVAVGVGLLLGTLLGLLAGAAGGVADAAVMRVVDVLLSVPGLLLALTVIILLGPGTVNVAIAVGVGSVAAFARLARAEVVRVRRTDYVEAAFGSGGRYPAVLWRHVRWPPCSSARPSWPSRRSASSATAPNRPPPSGGCSSPKDATTWPPRGG